MMQSSVGVALTATKGYAAEEAGAAYARAHKLSRTVEGTPRLFPVLREPTLFDWVRISVSKRLT